jgi:hypothetical protein
MGLATVALGLPVYETARADAGAAPSMALTIELDACIAIAPIAGPTLRGCPQAVAGCGEWYLCVRGDLPLVVRDRAALDL